MSLSEADRWQIISAALAALCLFLGLLLWQASAQIHLMQRRTLSALDACTLTSEDREHL